MKHLLNIEKPHFTFDSREVRRGSIFIALTTGTRDGHDFALSALEKGADTLILSREVVGVPAEKSILVPDTLAFITELATEKFEVLKARGARTIALTGSIGKTTTKEFLGFLLRRLSPNVHITEGNFNNHIGVPLTILNAPLETEFLVLEMGMNHVGEIAALVQIAPAEVRIITNISPAHIGNFAGLQELAMAKAEILNASTRQTTFITKPNLAFLNDILVGFAGRLELISAPEAFKNEDGRTLFSVEGRQYALTFPATAEWVKSLLFGLKTLEVLGLDLPAEIAGFKPAEGRGSVLRLSAECVVLDESYNSSVEACINSIKTLRLYGGKKLIILGEMRELGEHSRILHQRVLESINFEAEVWLVGEVFKSLASEVFSEMAGGAPSFFANTEELLQSKKKADFLGFNAILLKGSNSVGLSKAVDFLLQP